MSTQDKESCDKEMGAILSFWFGSCIEDPDLAKARGKLWYGGGSADGDIRRLFGDLLHHAESDELDIWQESPKGSLALVILLDQFSRNIYRGSAKAFKNDNKALAITEAAIDSAQDRSLSLIERAFLYHPYEHAESLSAQKQSVMLFSSLVQIAEDAPMLAWQPQMKSFAQYAQKHSDIIQQFGRYPHRNAILGRTSSDAEENFLTQSGNRFGQ